MVASPDVGQALMESGAYAERASRPVTDEHGRFYEDADGSPLFLNEVIEQASGQALLSRSVWNEGRAAYRPGVNLPQPAMVKDPYDRDDPSQPFSASTRAVAAQIAAQNPSLTGQRPTARFPQPSPAQSAAYSRMLAHPDFTGETSRTRAARLPRQQPREIYDELTGQVSLAGW